MKWRIWFKPKRFALNEAIDKGHGDVAALEDAQRVYSEVVEAERAFVDPYSKALSFLPKSEIEQPAPGEKRKKGWPKKVPVHAIRVCAADVWKEFEQA